MFPAVQGSRTWDNASLKRLLWLCAVVVPLAGQDAVRYELSFPNAVHHEAEVRATFSGITGATLEVVMSRSSPGRYALHEFAKNVYNVRATDSQGRALLVERPTPYQWNVSGHDGAVTFAYTLFGDRVDGTYVAVDPSHAHLNAPASLVWARGFEQRPVEVRFDMPAGSGWEAATQLEPRADGAWLAPNRDWLMDSPMELSRHLMREWDVEGAHFRMVLHGEATPDAADSYARMCQAVVLEEEGVFGRLAPYDHGVYTFLMDYLPYASGDGMEHRNSTIITGARGLERRSAADLIDTVAHEFFHSWNVERMRPRALEPFDFERANMSGELWFAEGFTSYFAPLVQTRVGILTLEDLASEVGSAVNTVLTAPGREVFDVVDMSRRAPFADGASGIDPTNQSNIFISYYTYGEALGLGFDLAIRSRFPGKSLEDWMRAMWREHPDVDHPYTLADLEAALGEATSAEFAHDMFQRHVYGLEPIDYAALLPQAGLVLRPTRTGAVWLGATGMSYSGRGVILTGATLRGSPLYRAGIDRGDRLVKAGKREIKNQRDMERVLDSSKPGETVTFTVEGRTGARDVDVTWAQAPGFEIVTYEKAGLEVTDAIRAFRESWLRSKALHPLPDWR